ncbi:MULTISPECIES: type II secretion system protein GspM [Vibrio]|uniref:type II secretion system protein GspM n=1 Tax=Vibrio TaxID=662 RepID=UPI0001B94FDE|nr:MULTISPECIES: type II secretion system protein GspM [Vibrio]EEX34945.1 MSHA biogenesis protein MshJ [Vibrio coralliilyticus ATCC BAA-450]MCM5511125.1 type 4a pilus biogenesis protein PilO [Vibrio sp. SCSIO 43169]MDE3898263.1 type 4a pilus biogenesis protein PilO [Vibrio sp. CC007]QFT37671.1 General secretion pathway, M protein [Vibrio sp. THAF64]QGM35574.1 General secretion pathway, M protein [Vibrio sp. THAF191d]
MQQLWLQLNDKFQTLSLREKWLLTLCGLVVLSVMLLIWLIEPTVKANHALSGQLSSTKQTVQRLEGDILLATAKLNKDPNQNIDLEFKKLLTESQQLSEQLAQIIENLISPSQMARLLEDVLAGTKGLKLVSLESMTAEPITGGADNQTRTGYYLHPVRLELTGSYFSILTYLNTLESLPVNYYWRSFSYTVEVYPTARLVLEVYTLGTRQEFIGG